MNNTRNFFWSVLKIFPFESIKTKKQQQKNNNNNKTKQKNKKFPSYSQTNFYNQFHNILRLFDVLPNFTFTTSETVSDYYL